MQTSNCERATEVADGAALRHKALRLNTDGYCERETVVADGTAPRHRAQSAISV